ncbi:phosphoenolpyruvate--protein phosphotransferase [Corallincola spongiicola]|uniref:phosphoenolpyruvate--protein phosphotransferase n=1 Tax=Corallincola spongiicola TaxID=2520508 RepID=A0ABY1WNT8_9GAMM|nr:phosphoenolpyruvate--protein phosphotransferase [Corallincola spongiicola]TAA45221.1 phosphoenolpyruvate--protein phosphotransferase [Corallincola spongiicola]
MAQPSLQLKAPLSGYIRSIEDVPDPVFAQKMVGDGIAIDPTSQVLVSPIDGTIVQIHPAKHAVTIRSEQGVEVLMHIGLDTVLLKGEGFFPLVTEGERVTVGQPLVDFDADQIALNARSLLTIIIVTNGELVHSYQYGSGHVEAEQDTVLELSLGETSTQEIIDKETYQPVTSSDIVIPNPAGLHARPSATLANLAKHYQSEITLVREGLTANAKSVVAIMGLNVQFGSTIQITAKGRDGAKAIEELTEQIHLGLGEEVGEQVAPSAAAVAEPEEAPLLQIKSDEQDVLIGVSASPGLAIGEIYQIVKQTLSFDEDANDSNTEQETLVNAIECSRSALEKLQTKLKAEGATDRAEIFSAHQELLEDPGIYHEAKRLIHTGKSAAFAWDSAIKMQKAVLTQLDNEVLAARANDLEDVGQRVLHHILGYGDQSYDFPQNSILIAEDLTPSDTANLDKEKVIGFCTSLGGSSSHVAIIARSMNLPAIAGIDKAALELPAGRSVILDGGKGKLYTAPTAEKIKQIEEQQAQHATARAEALSSCMEPAVTTDGHHMEIVANIGSNADAIESIKLGGEGVGLLRSEFLYLDRVSEPDEETQTQIYSEIAETLGKDKPLIIRTLDVGGDKPLAYMPLPEEENPFLGERGIRVGLNRPSMLRRQVRAVLRANEKGKVRIMFPMIATLPELLAAKGVVIEEAEKLGITGVEIGIMIEVPAAAVMAEIFAEHVDFFSIGTNDLTQYTLAMDRGHPVLAPMVDALNPAVLRLIDMTVKGANAHGKWVGVCGGVAGDPIAVPILVGLGVAELSVSVPVLPEVKANVRKLNYEQCKQFAVKALAQPDATAVRNLSMD